MKFIHITDLHLTLPGAILFGSDPASRLTTCLNDIAGWHGDAEFCVITGDLTEAAEPEAYNLLNSKLEAFPLKTFLLLGNHDDRPVFRECFADHPCDVNGFIQHRHETEQGDFLFLDTTKDGKDVHEGEYCQDRLHWLSTQLREAGDKPTYLFMHHPPFDIGIPYVDEIRLLEQEAFFEALSHGRNIQHCFFGHVHRSAFIKWRGLTFTCLPSLNHQIPLVPESVGTELSLEPTAYGVALIDKAQLTVHFEPFLNRLPNPDAY